MSDDHKYATTNVVVDESASLGHNSKRVGHDATSSDWTTSRTELWSFYAYYVVSAHAAQFSHSSSISDMLGKQWTVWIQLQVPQSSHCHPPNISNTVGPSQFQNLLFLAGYDPAYAPFTVACTEACVLPYLGKVRDINAIVLTTNGISFAIQAVLLLFIGSWADYGRWRCGHPLRIWTSDLKL